MVAQRCAVGQRPHLPQDGLDPGQDLVHVVHCASGFGQRSFGRRRVFPGARPRPCLDPGGQRVQPLGVAAVQGVVPHVCFAQAPQRGLGRQGAPVVGQPQQSRGEHLLQVLAGKVALGQIQDAQRQLERRRRQGRTAAALAPGNSDPVQRGRQLLGHPPCQPAGRNGDGVGRRPRIDQIGAGPRDLARLRGRRRAGPQGDPGASRRARSAEQGAEKAGQPGTLRGIVQLELGGGLVPPERLERAQRGLHRLAQVGLGGPGQADPDAQPPGQDSGRPDAQRCPVEDGVEGHFRRAPQGRGQLPASGERLDRQPQRAVRVGEAAPVESVASADQQGSERGDPLPRRLGKRKPLELRGFEEPLPERRQQVLRRASEPGLVPDAPEGPFPRRLLAAHVAEQERERLGRGDLRASSRGSGLADQLALQLGERARHPAGDERDRPPDEVLFDASGVGQHGQGGPGRRLPPGVVEAELGGPAHRFLLP